MRNFSSSFFFVILLITITSSCDKLPSGEHYLVQLKPSSNNPQQLEATAALLNKRLQTVYDNDVTATIKNGQIELDVTEKVNLKDLLFLVTNKGSFTLNETYPKEEIQQAIISIDPEVKGIGYLVIDNYGNGIGTAGRYDTAQIMASPTLQALKKRFPELEFSWSRETEEWSMTLFALKKSRSGLDNSSIKTSYTNIDDRGNEAVSIELKRNFHNRWANMTRENIQKPIAIRLDNQVLSAPIVNSEIPNGNLMISGGGDDWKPRLIAALVANEVLPVSLTVTSIDPALQPSSQRSYPTTVQIARYDSMRKDFIQYRHGIDSILMNAPAHLNRPNLRHEVSRVYYEDLPTIVDQVGLSEEQVNQFLDKATGTLQGFKRILAGGEPINPDEEFFKSLEAQ